MASDFETPGPTTYYVQWADGLAFRILNFNSKVKIDHSTSQVIFLDTNEGTVTCDFRTENGENLVFRIPDSAFGPPERSEGLRRSGEGPVRGVITQWTAPPLSPTEPVGPKSRTFFGEIFVGDPDGTGGFGGYGDGG